VRSRARALARKTSAGPALKAGQGEEPERKQAPLPFVGQRHVVEYFARLGPERLAHAYLLHGPRGTGKRTFARMLAWTLNCDKPTSFPLGYCGVCGPCVRGIHGSSGDITEVDLAFIRATDTGDRKTDDISMAQARAIIERMQFKSYEGGRPVCIIPDFENVTQDEVPNALLKEIEEPGQEKLFLLTSEREESLLPTIRSRAVALRFGPLTDEEIATQLTTHFGETRERALSLARRAQGSLGDAIADRNSDTAVARDAARDWLLSCLASPARLPDMPQLGKDDARAQLNEVLRQARISARDLMVSSISGAGALFDTHAGARYAEAKRAIGPAAAMRAAKAIELVRDASRLANTNMAPATVLGWLQVQLRSLGDQQSAR
jgi:DNA polymerase-3 subunit delta'